MIEVLAIVKNSIGETIGYDIYDTITNKKYENIKINELLGKKLVNAIYVGGKTPYIKGKKTLQIREVQESVILYHGSNHIVGQPVINGGKLNNDYGMGFYTTSIPERADEWALMMPGDSIRNKYELDISGLKILDLDSFGPLAWISEVLKNRGAGGSRVSTRIIDVFLSKYNIDTTNYDVIHGYRADDSYFMIIESFLNNEISVEEVVGLFYKAKLGKQIFLKSNKAFNKIKYIGADRVSQERLRYAINNDKNARRVVKDFIDDRRYAIALKQINMTGKLTFYETLNKTLVYNKKDGRYHEA